MGRRYVLLELSEADSELLVKGTQGLPWEEKDDSRYSTFLQRARVAWIIGKPTRTCHCGLEQDPTTGRKRRSRGRHSSGFGFRKGARFGWWVHAGCGRPIPLYAANMEVALASGHYDLIPEILRKLTGEDVPDTRETFKVDGSEAARKRAEEFDPGKGRHEWKRAAL